MGAPILPGRRGAEGKDIPQNVPAPWPPLLEVTPLGERLRAGRREGRMWASAPTCGLPQQYLARRASWTLPGRDTRLGSGSGCWGARVCRFRAPVLNRMHPRQNRGMEKGVSPFSLLLLGTFLGEARKVQTFGAPRPGPTTWAGWGKAERRKERAFAVRQMRTICST